MQNAKSGARAQHRQPKDQEVPSPVEAAAQHRGRDLKRYVRAAAALRELYDDTMLADAAGVGRGAVAGWWRGARMSTDTIRVLADATGLSRDELTSFVHYDGPPPGLPAAGTLPVLEGARRAAERRGRTGPDTPPPQPARRSRGSGGERG